MVFRPLLIKYFGIQTGEISLISAEKRKKKKLTDLKTVTEKGHLEVGLMVHQLLTPSYPFLIEPGILRDTVTH